MQNTIRNRSKSKSKSKSKSINNKSININLDRQFSQNNSILPIELSDYIKSVYSKYKYIDYSVLDDLKSSFLKANDKFAAKFPLQIFHISNKGVILKTDKINAGQTKNNILLFKKTLDYAKKNNLPIPTTTMYLWVSDSHPYYLNNMDKKFPIMTYCTPSNMDYILFPDETFTCLYNFSTTNNCDFDYVKKMILDNIVSEKDKIDKIYFKGLPTTKHKGKLREDLEKISKDEESKLIVNLDSAKNYEPVYTWSRYKYLLNLPGLYPWSNRLKYLFLTKSLVINVDVSTIGKDYIDGPYMTLTNLLIKPNIDYINIESSFNNKIRTDMHPTKKDLDIQFKENRRVYNQIIKKTDKISPQKYREIVESGFKKINSINNETIYLYVYNLILANAKLIKA
jgi:hypothetical protein